MKENGVLAKRFRVHYNTVRPNSSFEYRPPAPEAAWQRALVMEKWKLLRASHTPDCDHQSTKTGALH